VNASRKQLFVSIAVVVVVLVGYNALIAHNARKTQRKRLLTKVETMPLETDCVFLGNSLVEAGCDLDAFRSAWPSGAKEKQLQPMNLALGATSTVEHYLILKHALERPVKVKYLIYGFFDDQLNAPPQGRWSDLVGNRALSYYFPAEAAALYAPGSTWKRLELEMSRCIPMVAERSTPWTKVEILRRSLEEIGMPKKKTNRYGRVEDFNGLEAADIKSFNERCEKVLRNSGKLNGEAGFSTPIQAIIRLAHDHGSRVILVEMPMPSRHRDTFYSSPSWAKMREQLQKMAAREGTYYLAASDWVKDDGKFEDATHLNEAGAKDFSARLAAAVSGIPEPETTQMAAVLR
jgi:hypothetical protein